MQVRVKTHLAPISCTICSCARLFFLLIVSAMLLASQSILFYRDMCTSALRAMFLPWPATCGLSIIFTKAVRISCLAGWWFVELLLLLLLVSMSLASFERKWRNSLIDSYWLQMHRRCIVGSPRAMQTQRVCSSTQLIRGRRAPA